MQSKFENPYEIPRKFGIVNPNTNSDIHFAYDMANDIRQGELTDVEAIRQSIHNILTTIPGERLFNIEFGTRLWTLIFNSNITSLTESDVITIMLEDINKWEDRVYIDTNNTRIAVDYDNKSVHIEIPFIIKNTSITDIYSETIYN